MSKFGTFQKKGRKLDNIVQKIVSIFRISIADNDIIRGHCLSHFPSHEIFIVQH